MSTAEGRGLRTEEEITAAHAAAAARFTTYGVHKWDPEKRPFVKRTTCVVTYVRGDHFISGIEECACCDKPTAARIVINNNGSVSEVDVCQDHAEWDGRRCDGLPPKQRTTGAVHEDSPPRTHAG